MRKLMQLTDTTLARTTSVTVNVCDLALHNRCVQVTLVRHTQTLGCLVLLWLAIFAGCRDGFERCRWDAVVLDPEMHDIS